MRVLSTQPVGSCPVRYGNATVSGKKRNLTLRSFCTKAVLVVMAFVFSFSASAQLTPKSCGKTNCTSNDVHIVRAYISGKDNSAINCSDAEPFKDAELHLVLYSKTGRIGASISGNLVADGVSYSFGQCFTGKELNIGSDNNLWIPVGSLLAAATCTTDFELKNLFISWGTGNTDFCSLTNNNTPRTEATDPNCPETPAKCRFVDGEVIDVDIKLNVDFNWVPGTCEAGTSNTVNFTPLLDLGSDIDQSSIKYAWDFNNDGTTDSEDANPQYTFAGPGTYPVTLTVTAKDINGGDVTPAPRKLDVMIQSCCNLEAPSLGNANFCVSSGQTKTVADLIATFPALSDGEYLVYATNDGETPLKNSEVLTSTAYYVSILDAPCESGRAQVDVTVKANTDAPTVNAPCAGATIVTGTSEAGASIIVYKDDNGSLIQIGTAVANGSGKWSATVSALSAGDLISATAEASGKCVSGSSQGVTVKSLPDAGFTPATACASSLAIFTASGSGITSYSWYLGSDLTNPKSTGSTYTTATGAAGTTLQVTLTVVGSNGCSNTSSQTVTVTSCSQNTLTQGFYGNTTGKACPDNALAVDILAKWLQGSGRVIGNGANNLKYLSGYVQKGPGSFTITSGQASVLNGMMPGGSSPNRINTTQTSLLNYTTSTIPKSNNKIVNVLITQTITLGVNIYRNGSLANVLLEPGKYATVVKSSSKCVIPADCSGGKVTSIKMSGVSTAFATYINGKTVEYLYNLANDALGGGNLPSNVSYSDINAAIDFVNKLFDGGVLYLGNFSTAYVCASQSITARSVNRVEENMAITELKISAFPNPYTNKVNFTITSPVAGKANLQVYNVLGQNVKTIYTGYMQAGQTQTIGFDVPSAMRTMLFYKLQIGDRQLTGKVMPADRK